jgi:hypothetical protein
MWTTLAVNGDWLPSRARDESRQSVDRERCVMCVGGSHDFTQVTHWIVASAVAGEP